MTKSPISVEYNKKTGKLVIFKNGKRMLMLQKEKGTIRSLFHCLELIAEKFPDVLKYSTSGDKIV